MLTLRLGYMVEWVFTAQNTDARGLLSQVWLSDVREGGGGRVGVIVVIDEGRRGRGRGRGREREGREVEK